jgi:hypothetical protein
MEQRPLKRHRPASAIGKKQQQPIDYRNSLAGRLGRDLQNIIFSFMGISEWAGSLRLISKDTTRAVTLHIKSMTDLAMSENCGDFFRDTLATMTGRLHSIRVKASGRRSDITLNVVAQLVARSASTLTVFDYPGDLTELLALALSACTKLQRIKCDFCPSLERLFAGPLSLSLKQLEFNSEFHTMAMFPKGAESLTFNCEAKDLATILQQVKEFPDLRHLDLCIVSSAPDEDKGQTSVVLDVTWPAVHYLRLCNDMKNHPILLGGTWTMPSLTDLRFIRPSTLPTIVTQSLRYFYIDVRKDADEVRRKIFPTIWDSPQLETLRIIDDQTDKQSAIEQEVLAEFQQGRWPNLKFIDLGSLALPHQFFCLNLPKLEEVNVFITFYDAGNVVSDFLRRHRTTLMFFSICTAATAAPVDSKATQAPDNPPFLLPKLYHFHVWVKAPASFYKQLVMPQLSKMTVLANAGFPTVLSNLDRKPDQLCIGGYAGTKLSIDLDLDFQTYDTTTLQLSFFQCSWPEFVRLLQYFPNLKHLLIDDVATIDVLFVQAAALHLVPSLQKLTVNGSSGWNKLTYNLFLDALRSWNKDFKLELPATAPPALITSFKDGNKAHVTTLKDGKFSISLSSFVHN